MKLGGVENQLDASHILGHLVSIGAIFGAFVGYVPYIAAIVAIVWYLLQIWESPFVQRFRPTPTPMEREQRLTLLVASAKILAAEIVALRIEIDAERASADPIRDQ